MTIALFGLKPEQRYYIFLPKNLEPAEEKLLCFVLFIDKNKTFCQVVAQGNRIDCLHVDMRIG